MNQPLVSIILPVYNAQNHLARCVGSICAQTYSNIEIINQYAGVQRKESASGQVQYQTKIHVNGDFIVGTYADEISAAIAYNKAADTLAAHGISKAYARNYIVSMTNEQYHTAYTSISISKKLTAPAP